MNFFSKTFQLLFVRLISIPLVTGASIVLVRTLGPERLGEFNEILVVPLFLVSIFGIGLPAAITYFLCKEMERAPEIIGNVVWVMVIGGTALVAGFYAAFPLLEKYYYHSSQFRPYLGLLLGFIFVRFCYRFTPALGRGLDQVTEFSFATSIALPFCNLCGYIFFIWYLGWGVKGALVVSLLTYIVINIILLFIIKRRTGISLAGSSQMFKKKMGYGWKTGLTGLAKKSAGHLDILLLAYFFSPQMLGIYAVAKTAASYTGFIRSVVSPILFPKIAMLQARKDKLFMAQFLRYFNLSMLLSAIGMYVVMPLLIPLFYGKIFSGAIWFGYLLIPGVVAMGFLEVISAYLMGLNLLGRQLFLYILRLGLLSFLLVLTSLTHDMANACLAISLANIMTAVIAMVVFYQHGLRIPWREIIILKKEDCLYLWRSLNTFYFELLKKFRSVAT